MLEKRAALASFVRILTKVRGGAIWGCLGVWSSFAQEGACGPLGALLCLLDG